MSNPLRAATRQDWRERGSRNKGKKRMKTLRESIRLVITCYSLDTTSTKQFVDKSHRKHQKTKKATFFSKQSFVKINQIEPKINLVGFVFGLGASLPGVEVLLHLSPLLDHLLGSLGLRHPILKLELSLILLHVLLNVLLLLICSSSNYR